MGDARQRFYVEIVPFDAGVVWMVVIADIEQIAERIVPLGSARVVHPGEKLFNFVTIAPWLSCEAN